MKKKLTILLVLVMVFTFTGCKDVKYGNFEKVADNLYVVDYDKYDIDYANEDVASTQSTSFGCSSVRVGNYYGRSFDFIYGDVAEVVVKVPSKDGRYASIGVMGGLLDVTPEAIENGELSEDMLKMIPLAVTDGINEKGVVCNMNVVPACDLEKFTTGTNPDGDDLNMQILVRYVLDNAGSAKEAVELIKGLNITDEMRDVYGVKSFGYEGHLMVADKDDTYVIEFINNEVKVCEGQNIMTNFYVGLDEYTPHASGIERYEFLEKNLDSVKSMDDMANLMKQVKFSDSYRKALPSDMVEGEHTNEVIAQSMGAVREFCNGIVKSMPAMFKTGDNPEQIWITMHMTTFDIEKKIMRVIVQERYDEPFEFTF
ncbi:MAG: linear amide C-N hydrolase [Clostridia bacterium]|nr:linear amide C-N hydrolase [Clostridia bacterium]